MDDQPIASSPVDNQSTRLATSSILNLTNDYSFSSVNEISLSIENQNQNNDTNQEIIKSIVKSAKKYIACDCKVKPCTKNCGCVRKGLKCNDRCHASTKNKTCYNK